MSKVIIRTSSIHEFFERAHAIARKIDRGEEIVNSITFSFGDPDEMLSVLSKPRRKILQHVMKEAKTINQLVEHLKRSRSVISRDVKKLEQLGLLITNRSTNPEHGAQKTVKSVASKIELCATLI